MESIEPMEERLELVDMHKYFKAKIKKAMEDKDYITATWLIYSCLENRYFRTLAKYKGYCKYSKGKCKDNKNQLALSTKISCVKRLFENNVSCITNSFSIDLLDETKKWVERRNELMHNLLALDTYRNSDADFKEIAEYGNKLLNETYDRCTKFRALFFEPDYHFEFPDKAMEGCNCKPKKSNSSASNTNSTHNTHNKEL